MKIYVSFEIEDTWLNSVLELLGENGMNANELKQALADGSVHNVKLMESINRIGLTPEMLKVFIPLLTKK